MQYVIAGRFRSPVCKIWLIFVLVKTQQPINPQYNETQLIFLPWE